MSDSTTSSDTSTSQSDSSTNGSGNSHSEATVSDSGPTVHGQPGDSGTKSYSAAGTAVEGGTDSGRKIEDVTDTNRLYEERMEDEYAKREGGA